MATTVLPSDAPTGNKPLTVGPGDEADRPNIPHPAYHRMKARWQKCRDLMAGTQAIRDGGETYLPRYELESVAGYDIRKRLCAVFSGFKRTVKACVGLILEKDPELGDDVAAPLKAVWEDFDRAGTHGAVYTKLITTDAMIDGHAATFVDWPRIDDADAIDREQEIARGARPFCVRYVAEDILKVVVGKINGVKSHILVVLKETSEEVVGDFGVRTVTRYRVYRRSATTGITWELWREEPDSQATTREVDARPLKGVSRIPFSRLIIGERVGDFETRPPLEDLADLNIEHHQVKTDIRNLERLACAPTTVRIGARLDESGLYPPITRGPRSVIEAPAIQGVQKPIYWDSPDVTVLEPSNRSLQDIKADMGAAGLAFLAPDKRAAETAEAKRIDASAQNATLSTASRAVQDHLEEVFGFIAEYLSIPKRGGSVTLNRDFEKVVLDPAMLTALSNAAANGKLSLDTFLMLLEKMRLLPEGFNREDEIRRILTEGNLQQDPEPDREPEKDPPTDPVPADD